MARLWAWYSKRTPKITTESKANGTTIIKNRV